MKKKYKKSRRKTQSKVFRDYDTGEVFFYTHNTLDDIVDRVKNKIYLFRYLSDIVPVEKTRRTSDNAKAKAKAIAIDLFELIADDLIKENDIFVFPKSPFGYMKVSNMTSAHPKYKNVPYNFKTDGAYYEGRIMLDMSIQRLNKKHFRFRFQGRQRRKLNIEIDKGRRY